MDPDLGSAVIVNGRPYLLGGSVYGHLGAEGMGGRMGNNENNNKRQFFYLHLH